MTLLKVEDFRSLLERDQEFQTDLGVVSSDLFLDWINRINYAYWRKAQQVDPERIMSEQSVTVSGSNLSETIATLHSLNVSGAGIYEKNDDGYLTGNSLPRRGRDSQLNGYYVSGTTIEFVPKTWTQSTDYLVRFIAKIAKLAADDEDTLIDDQYEDFALNAIKRVYQIWDRDAYMNITDAQFLNAMDELWEDLRPDEDPPFISDNANY